MGDEINKTGMNPFPGLRPFQPEESDLFFGREGESAAVLSKLMKNRFVTVIGASGTGKSSLIYCGVIPGLRKLTGTGKSGWKVITLRPGNDPLGNLAASIAKEAGRPEQEDILSTLKKSDNGLSESIKNTIGSNSGTLVVVDQFEELFRYSVASAGIVPGNDAAEFVNILENSVKQNEIPVYVIITMRSDFIGECAHFQGFTQLINDSNYLVPHMSRDNYRAAIEGPVKYAGAAIEPALVDMILDHIGDQTDQLPVLQHALMRTWLYWQELEDPNTPISVKDYEAVGTMSEAMSLHANEAFDELTPTGKSVCEKLFRTITEKGADNKGVRHPASVRIIKHIIGCDTAELVAVIEKFRITSRSFLTPREGVSLNEESVIDVSHESLMRLWDRLREWVDDEAASVQMYLRLSEASALYQMGKATLWRPPDLQLAINWRDRQNPSLEWAERYDPAFERAMVYLRTSEKEFIAEEENKIRLQKRQIKRTKIVAMILGTASIISIGFMLFAFIARIEADNQRIVAEEKTVEAQVQTQKADSSARVARDEEKRANENARVALEKSEEARREQQRAELQQSLAEKNAKEAKFQAGVAKEQSDSAIKASERAIAQKRLAEEQRQIANQRRMISLAKSMAVKSQSLNGQKDLQSLVAYQAYLFNKRHDGASNDADIYQGLYNIARQYGNVNYKQFKGHNGINAIAMVPGSPEFYTSGYDGKLLKWNLNDKETKINLVYSGTEIIEVLAVSPDASWLACGQGNAAIRMIPVKGNGVQYELKGHSGKVKSLVFSYDGKYLYSAALDGKVLKWDLAARTAVDVDTEKTLIKYIDISSGGKYLAGISTDGKALVWNPETKGDSFRIASPGKEVRILRFRPGNNTVAIGYSDGTVELWDVESRKNMGSISAHSAEVKDIKFNEVLGQMATGGGDKMLKLWDIKDLTTPPIAFSDNEGFVMAIEFSHDGQIVISGMYEGAANLVARPTNADLLARDVCTILSRNMKEDEWATYVAKDLNYEKTCTEKDFSIKVNVVK
jgi:WD40 repeat protein